MRRVGVGLAVALALSSVSLSVATPARSAVVNLWHTAGNGSITIDNYSVPGAGVIARTANSAAASDVNPFHFMQIWAVIYSDIPGCMLPGCGAYSSTNWGDVWIQPTGSQGIRFLGFDLGSYLVPRTSTVEIFNGDLSAQIGVSFALTPGATHASYSTDVYSQNGFHIRFESFQGNVGINNIAFEVTDAPPVATPLPAALPLFASVMGLGGLIGWRSRRRRAA